LFKSGEASMNAGHGTSRHTIGSDHIDIEWLGPSAFLVREQKTLLGRLYNQWIDCGETMESGFLLPFHETFKPNHVTRGNEDRMIIRVETPGGMLPITPIDETAIIGRDHPFGIHTHSAIYKCLTERGIVYLRISMELTQLHVNFMRLLLPVVDEQDRVTAIYMSHRFMGEPFQVIESDPFTWTPS
jgi:hypothetical protein